MKNFRARFVVSARNFDAEGFAFFKDVDILTDAAEVSHLLAGDFARVQGGYVLLFNSRVWNSGDHAVFDPRHVRCDMDSLSYAAMMLEDVAGSFYEPQMHFAALTEMISLQIVHVTSDQLALSGVHYRREVRYPTETVNLGRFVRQLLRATNRFLRVAGAELDHRLSFLPVEERSSAELTNRKMLDRFQQASERIRRFTKTEGTRAGQTEPEHDGR